MNKFQLPILAGFLALMLGIPSVSHAASMLGEVPNLNSLFGGSDMFGPIPTFPYGSNTSVGSRYESGVFGPIPVFEKGFLGPIPRFPYVSNSSFGSRYESGFLGPIPVFEKGFLGPIPKLLSDGTYQ